MNAPSGTTRLGGLLMLLAAGGLAYAGEYEKAVTLGSTGLAVFGIGSKTNAILAALRPDATALAGLAPKP
jgi:hypothetical protein